MLQLTFPPLTLLFLVLVLAQSVRAQDCAAPQILANARNYNIFSPEQEMVLGDLTYERLSSEHRFIRDPALVAYIERIGERLNRHLPPIGIKFRFFIIDIPEANAFNIPGGYVFVSRKLIAFSNNEDELAGVLAHELGHAVVRHGANYLSEAFKEVLNVTQVGDRKDIAEKYNLFIERHRTKRGTRRTDHENQQQLEADRIGLFAMISAGYDGNAFADFFARLTEAKAASGGWFASVFGKAKPEEKRLREMINTTNQIPGGCKEPQQAMIGDFVKWQADVVSSRELNQKEQLPALLWQRELSPRLRTDISNFAFSKDGRFFLAQDDFSITVIQRDPLKVLFQFPAAFDARPATFTPDGQFVVYGTEGLRFEKWSVAEQKLVAARELVLRRDCWEHEYSPDGNYLMCVGYDMALRLVDTQTGKRLWEKKVFYRLTFFEWITWVGNDNDDKHDELRRKFFHVEFSPDSKTVVVSRSSSYRFKFLYGGLRADSSDDTVVALDLATLKPINISGEFKKRTRLPFVFIGPGKILFMSRSREEDGGMLSFPEGKRLSKFPIAARVVKATENSRFVIVKPLSQTRMGFVDVDEGKLVAALDKRDAALWGDVLVYETAAGTILVAKVQLDESKKTMDIVSSELIEIPLGQLSNVSTVEISPNFQWLAVSSKTRGAVWNLNSGERHLYVRGFRGALLTESGAGICEISKSSEANHSLVRFNPLNKNLDILKELPDRGAQLFGPFLLTRESLKQRKVAEDQQEKDEEGPFAPQTSEVSLSREVRIELKNIVTNKVVWFSEFPKEAPNLFFDSYSGRMILYWPLSSDAAKARMKSDPSLTASANAMGNKDDDYLIEIIDAFAAKSLGHILIETGKGSFDITNGLSEGDWLVLHDSENRFLAYSIKERELKNRFFGAEAALNPSRNQIVVENYPGELTVYDLVSGESQGRLIFNSNAEFVRFSLDGRKLMVLTDQQKVYVFDAQKQFLPAITN